MTLAALCKARTTLSPTDVAQLEHLVENLEAISNLCGGDVFIDCLDTRRSAFVVAHARPHFLPSKYEGMVLGLDAERGNEPAVYAAFARGIPFHDHIASTQEQQTVRQDVTPVKNSAGTVIAVIIAERNVGRETVMARKLEAVDAQLHPTEASPSDSFDGLQTREAHHRIKNHLQILASICSMRARTQGQSEQTSAALQEIGRMVRSVAWLHEFMCQVSETGAQQLELSAILGALVSGLRGLTDARTPAHFHLDCTPLSIDANYAMPIVLVVNELITNALVHSRPIGDLSIALSLQKGNHSGTVVVTDNGASYAPSISPGTGLRIVRSFVESSLHGQFHIAFGATGTSASFSFDAS